MFAMGSLMEPRHAALFSKHNCSNNFCFSCNWVIVDPKSYGPNLQVQTCISLLFQKVLTLGSQGALRPPMPFGSHYHTQGGWPIAPEIFVVFFFFFFGYFHLPLVLCSDKYWNLGWIGCLQVSDLGLRELVSLANCGTCPVQPFLHKIIFSTTISPCK